jgi:hypothetical protein
MLTRLAALFLAASLGSTTATAHEFARPPEAAPHLTRVEVPAPSRDDVRKALVARRDHNLVAFRAYRKGGVYPHNFIRSGPLNVWMDREGHLCAAATMIDKDGKHDLVKDTAAKTNSLRLLDVTEGPLMDWMLTSGFTIEEIDRIQAPMVYPDLSTDPTWREAEDARLRTEYATTDAWLVKHAKTGLDSAVTRLMAHPDLARKLVDSKI